jgi:hypothetical protein
MDPPPPILALNLCHGAWCMILKMIGWTYFEQALVLAAPLCVMLRPLCSFINYIVFALDSILLLNSLQLDNQ